MKFIKVLEERRSIRRFLDTPVEKEDLKNLIKAALMAPSWKNSETPRYYVVTSDDMLTALKENALPAGNAQKVKEAPVLIITSFKKGISGFKADGSAENECEDGWGYYDLGLASENLCLAAWNMGYGTLIMGIRNEAVIRKMLEIPEDEIIVSVIGLGVADEQKEAPQRKKVKEVARFF